MKIYFDGCAKTLGLHGCSNGWDKRFSTRLCEKLGAEEYNISRSGGSNRRLCRNLFEHQEKIHEFDLFIIQMSKRKRFEIYDERNSEWCNITECHKNPHSDPQYENDYINKSNPIMEKWKDTYFDEIYTDHLGNVDQKICYTCIKSVLQNQKHVILYMGTDKCNLPCDLKYNRDVDYIKKSHRYVTMDGKSLHDKISNDIIYLLDKA